MQNNTDLVVMNNYCKVLDDKTMERIVSFSLFLLTNNSLCEYPVKLDQYESKLGRQIYHQLKALLPQQLRKFGYRYVPLKLYTDAINVTQESKTVKPLLLETTMQSNTKDEIQQDTSIKPQMPQFFYDNVDSSDDNFYCIDSTYSFDLDKFYEDNIRSDGVIYFDGSDYYDILDVEYKREQIQLLQEVHEYEDYTNMYYLLDYYIDDDYEDEVLWWAIGFDLFVEDMECDALYSSDPVITNNYDRYFESIVIDFKTDY